MKQSAAHFSVALLILYSVFPPTVDVFREKVLERFHISSLTHAMNERNKRNTWKVESKSVVSAIE